MKKITLLLLLLLTSLAGFSQVGQTEGFENSPSPTGSLPQFWALDTGVWAIFENNSAPPNGTVENWGIHTWAQPPYQGLECASVSREQIGAGNTSEDYLATPLVTVPATGTPELHFWTRNFTSGDNGTIFKVMIAPLNANPDNQFTPGAYTDLATWSELDLIIPTTNFATWTEKTVPLPVSLQGQDIYIAFVRIYTQPTAAPDGDRWLIDNVRIDSQCTASAPTGTITTTSNSATVNWTNPSGATSWEVTVTPIATPNNPLPVYVVTTAPPYVITGLTPNTSYNYTVRAICSSGFSSPVSVISPTFTTQVAPPVCGGNLVDSGGIGGNYVNNANSTVTVCPVNAGDLVTVAFTAFNTEAGADFLRIYDGNDASATLLANLSGTTIPGSYTSTAVNGCLTFVFTSNATTVAAGYAANITCNPPPACRIPTVLNNSLVTTTSATLNWVQPANPDTSVATTWDIIVLPCNSPAPGAGAIPTVNDVSTPLPIPPYLLEGLTSGTCYDVYIRAVCGATNSGWTPVPTRVVTLVAPPVCGGNYVDSGGLNGNYGNNETLNTVICPVTAGDAVTVTWTAFNTQAATDILSVYDGNSTGATLIAALSGTTLPPAFTSTAANGCLTFSFVSNGTTNAAGWVANVTCGPPPGCAVPTSLASTVITHNSATLNWAQGPNPDASTPTSWEVLALPCGSPAPGAVPPTGPNIVLATTTDRIDYILSGLTPNTCYVVYVRAICGATTSGWNTIPTTFTTLIAPPECGGNYADAGGTAAAYAANSNVTTIICPVTPGDVVTVTFTSFNTETGFDALYVYDGNVVTPPALLASANPANNVPGGLAGGYWGTAIPGPFTSSAANGCLTFVFRSDGSVQNAGWLSNVTCGPPPTCRRPTAVTNNTVTSNSALISWTQPTNPDNSVATAWEIIAVPCGSPIPGAVPPANAIVVPATTNVNAPLTGLAPGTCYDVYVRALCSPTDISTPGGPTIFTTQVAPPVCGGNFVDAAGPAANYAPNSNVTTTICPVTPGDVVTVTFTSFNTEPNFDALYVYDGNAITAPQIASANPAANVPGGVAGGFWGTTIPGPFTSSAADGCLTFVFRSDGSVQNPGFLANVTCGPPPTCRRPTAIVVNSFTHNTATLTWTQPTNPDGSNATQWEVLAVPCGSPIPGAVPPVNGITAITTQNTNFLFPGLTSATCYDIYIRALCSPTDVSTWGGPVSITTLVQPPVCGGNFVDAGGVNGTYAANSNITTIICPTNPGEIVTVTFTAFNTEATWDALYVYDGNTVTPAALLPSPNGAGNVPGGLAGGYWGNTVIPGPFTSTTPDGCLTFVFRSDGSGQNPGWVSNITCAPAPPCARPVLLTAFPITQTSAILNWTQLPNPDGTTASQWEVLVLAAGSPVPTGQGIPVPVTVPPTTTYTANGLAPGTAYVFYVRAICSPTSASTWSALNFATQPVNDDCSAATFAIVNQNLNCVQTTPGTLAGATPSITPATTCGGANAANDDVWFTFTATTVTHVISFNNVTPATALSYAIYSGNCANGLTEIGCNTGAGLVAGTTYYIRVFSTGTAPVFTDFDLCIGTLPCTEAPAFCTGQTVTYANSTNVPSLGQIGCLFTSPNPAFFFLQVNQQGPLSYLISQVDNGGVGRDVDYVAWGPFTDLSTACTGVPANPLGQTVPIPTPATGCPGTLHACSYSTAPQEIMCIPNAQLCDVYVIMITNFSNQAGTVTFTQTNSGGGTTACFPINTFNYSQTYYCQGQPNPTPVLAPGASAGVYTSTPGLVIDSATGTIDLVASLPGNYIITSTSATTIGGTCSTIPFITTTRTVIITAPAAATIAYPNATYCNNIFTPEPVTRTGTIGGTYSASPAGLLLNGNTGEIIAGPSIPGVYTVTYTIPATGGCPAFNTTTQVEILATPVLTQVSVAACDTFTLPALAVGNYYTAAGGPGGSGTLITDLTITAPGTTPIYVYAEATNGCTAERQFDVTINTVPTPTFTVTQSSCTSPTGSLTVTAPVSGGNPQPANLFISEVTDADSGSLTYVEIYNATGAPVNLTNYRLKFYTWGTSSTAETEACNFLLSGTVLNNATYVVKVSNSAAAAGVTANLTVVGCGGVNENDNIRLTTASGTEIDVWGRIDGVAYSPASQPGYTYRRINPGTIPSTTWIPAEWTAIDPEDYTNVGSYTFVVSTYEYSLDNGTTYQSNPLFSNLAPGQYNLVVRDVTTGCVSDPIQVVIDAVNAIPTETGFTYPTPVCQNSTTNPSPTLAVGFTAGGTFTSNPATGIDLNPATGEINLPGTTAGTYDITYTVPFDTVTCQSFGSTTFEVVITNIITPVVVFSYTTPICQNAQATLTPTLDPAFTTGGAFTSTTGLVIDATTGVIDLAASTAGSYTITYTITGNSCQAQTVGTFDIVINPVIIPVVGFTYPTPVCQNATTNPSPTLVVGFTIGGTFTSNPSTGIDINPATGEINLAGTTAGNYTITYAVAANTATCQSANSFDFPIVISPVITPVVGFGYTTPICKNAQATLSPTLDPGFTTGGTYSSTTGLAINASTGVIDLATSTAGTYVVTYNVAANAATCQVQNSDTATIVINAVITPITVFSYATPFCSSATSNLESPTLDPLFTTGGTFSSTTGLIINASNGDIDTASTPGTYTVTYTVAANPATCQEAGVRTTQITISAPLLVELNGGCQDVYVLTVTPVNGSFNPETATFLWENAAGDDIATTQSFDVQLAGFYTVTVTDGGCSTTSAPFEVTSTACQIQRGISANNDDFNDTFNLTGFDVKKLTIFNRYGMEVYSRANYVNEWDGKSNKGEELPDGTYFYVLDKNTGSSITGWVYINRAQ